MANRFDSNSATQATIFYKNPRNRSSSSHNRIASEALLENEETLTEKCVQGMIHGKMAHKVDAIFKARNGILIPLQKQLICKVVDNIDDMTKRIVSGKTSGVINGRGILN